MQKFSLRKKQVRSFFSWDSTQFLIHTHIHTQNEQKLVTASTRLRDNQACAELSPYFQARILFIFYVLLNTTNSDF